MIFDTVCQGENIFCIHELLFELVPFHTILILEPFYLALEVHTWCIDLYGIENKNIVKCSYVTSIKKIVKSLL